MNAVAKRYGAAIVVMLLIGGIRAMLAPLLGTQAPLLPFLLGVFLCAYLAGRGPALVASIVTPILATFFFTDWPHDGPPTQWIAHVVFFLLIATLSSVLMHELQTRSRAEREALAIAANHAQALREADRRKDEFLAMLAHELRNPLAPIRNVGYVLSRGGSDPATVRHAGQMIERQATHLTRLVDDLLDVARITRGKLELKLERFSIRAAVDAALDATLPSFTEESQTVRSEIAEEELYVEADQTRVAQIVGNLLNNASKYTPHGGHVDLVVRREAGDVVIEVRDDGMGIPPDRLEDIFRMFGQVNPSLDRTKGGLGIGLALVRRLVDMHHGTVSAESEGPGKGSRFTVRLPAAAAPSAVAREEATGGPATSGATRVLIVDDNEDAGELLGFMLEQEGFDAVIVHDGPAAIRAATTLTPSVVILDIGLPGMSGYEVAMRLRENSSLSDTALIALSGWGSPEDKRRALDAGFDLHLTKPVFMEDLRRALGTLTAP